MMILRQVDGRWPEEIGETGSKVIEACLNRETADLRMIFQEPTRHTLREILIPSPWQFTSCLLSISSGSFETGQSGWIPADDLPGLEGSILTGFSLDKDRLDLDFGSITISVRKK